MQKGEDKYLPMHNGEVFKKVWFNDCTVLQYCQNYVL